jgi:hypothetical protein
MRIDLKNRIIILRQYFLSLPDCALKDSILFNLDEIEKLPDDRYKEEGITDLEDYLDGLD